MFSKTLTLALLALGAVASPVEVGAVEKRACPGVHVFGARETTASPGERSPFYSKYYSCARFFFFLTFLVNRIRHCWLCCDLHRQRPQRRNFRGHLLPSLRWSGFMR